MKKILLLMLIITCSMMISSCYSESGQLLSESSLMRVKELSVMNDGTFIASQVVEVKRVDTMYRVGDTLSVMNRYYVIVK